MGFLGDLTWWELGVGAEGLSVVYSFRAGMMGLGVLWLLF